MIQSEQSTNREKNVRCVRNFNEKSFFVNDFNTLFTKCQCLKIQLNFFKFINFFGNFCFRHKKIL